jgi:hypothetical protein
VSLDGLREVGGASVVEEEEPLPEASEGCCPELARSRIALDDVVGQLRPHVVQSQIREKIDRLVA